MSTQTDTPKIILLSSLTSGLAARLLCHPLDTIKSLIQKQPSLATSLHTNANTNISLSNIYKTLLNQSTPSTSNSSSTLRFLPKLYAGLPAAIIGGVPGTIIYLSTYEACKNQINTLLQSKGYEKDGFATAFASGMIAEIVSCVIYVPVDVVKERMQVQVLSSSSSSTTTSSGNYKSSLSCIKEIIKTEGVKGIYKGYGATILSYGPFSALYFGFYELLKDEMNSYYGISNANAHGDDREVAKEQKNQNVVKSLPFHSILLASATAGGLASFITSPLDMAKLRMQIVRRDNFNQPTTAATPSKSTNNYSTFTKSLKTIYSEGGVRNLWKGSLSRVIYFVPATAITMGVYEIVKIELKDRNF